MPQIIEHNIVVPENYAKKRLDQALAALLPQYSRSRIKIWIEKGMVSVDHNDKLRPKDILAGGEQVYIKAELEKLIENEPEELPLIIAHEDDAVIVVNKPNGLVVHPAAGNRSHTLLNALLYYLPELSSMPRAGIVHRLDKNTSGLLVIAKTPAAHASLVKQLQQHDIVREYEAVVVGVLTGGGTVDAPIGRHPKKRTHMAVRENGKPAITHYRVIERFRAHAHIKLNLETGGTHQIRVHMASIRHPIVGDQTYNGRFAIPKGATETLIQELRLFKRQALHARKLTFAQPITNELITVQADLPEDFKHLLHILREDNSEDNDEGSS